jgi:hypothetical protein
LTRQTQDDRHACRFRSRALRPWPADDDEVSVMQLHETPGNIESELQATAGCREMSVPDRIGCAIQQTCEIDIAYQILMTSALSANGPECQQGRRSNRHRQRRNAAPLAALSL